jgi:Arc/MetJ-type ribon-helix-helix transcriptional regulator
MSGEELKNELEQIMKNIETRLNDLLARIDRLVAEGKTQEAYNLWKQESTSMMSDFQASFEKFREKAKTSDEATQRELEKIFEEKFREIKSTLEKISQKLSKPSQFESQISQSLSTLSKSLENIGIIIGQAIDSVTKSLEETFKTIGKAPNIVSARINRKDLEIIDELVQAGIFRTRSEAVAFFVSKGIEASKDWVQRALDQARKIKELQEALRREVESQFKEE